MEDDGFIFSTELMVASKTVSDSRVGTGFQFSIIELVARKLEDNRMRSPVLRELYEPNRTKN